ncbi:SDR family NAD(P)-dependent oxidoreductase [Methylobacterium oxalidis]|uniref:SDR family NAD(P)-dependent oxidoreductase n=1 Tax=Methylobacterium oxalidis TaxID=944322 RepID=UPI0033154981
MGLLGNKVAIVVGGGSGIGLAISERFASEGAEVFATSRHEAALRAAVERIAGVRPIRADASDPHALRRAIEAIAAQRGRIDILVVGAGSSEQRPLADLTEEHFDRTFGLNVRALAFATQAAAGHMGAGSAVVLIGSIAALIGTPGYGVYAASKAAIRSFARTWAAELAPRGIRVNVVSPGPIDTALFQAVTDEVREALTNRIPIGRLGRPEEVAAAALFLASAESSFVTGADLCVDGGLAQV